MEKYFNTIYHEHLQHHVCEKDSSGFVEVTLLNGTGVYGIVVLGLYAQRTPVGGYGEKLHGVPVQKVCGAGDISPSNNIHKSFYAVTPPMCYTCSYLW